MTKPTLSPALAEFSAAVLSLASIVEAAQEAQWQPSHAPKPREDTTERAQGGHGDPTLATVIDDRRVDVREAVQAAEEVLDRAAAFTRRTEATLSRALTLWAGDSPDAVG